MVMRRYSFQKVAQRLAYGDKPKEGKKKVRVPLKSALSDDYDDDAPATPTRGGAPARSSGPMLQMVVEGDYVWIVTETVRGLTHTSARKELTRVEVSTGRRSVASKLDNTLC